MQMDDVQLALADRIARGNSIHHCIRRAELDSSSAGAPLLWDVEQCLVCAVEVDVVETVVDFGPDPEAVVVVAAVCPVVELALAFVGQVVAVDESQLLVDPVEQQPAALCDEQRSLHEVD